MFPTLVQHTPMLAWLVGWGSESGGDAHQLPWPDKSTSSSLQMDRTAGWDFYSWAIAKRNVVCQNLSSGCSKPCLPFLSEFGPRCISPADSTYVLCEARPEWVTRKNPTMPRKLNIPFGLSFSHRTKGRHRGALLMWGLLA